MRVLITGSRTWPSRSTICDALDHLHQVALARGEPMTIVSGHALGADRFAEAWAEAHNLAFPDGQIEIERHPISGRDWEKLGRAAGPLRNTHMVSLGADLCVAFHHNSSSGTRHCFEQAAHAGIPVWRHYTIGQGHPVSPPCPLMADQPTPS